MKYLSNIKTNTGRIRKNNEDNYYINEAAGLYAVFDGMGGLEYGEIASELAASCLKDFENGLEDNISGYITEANNSIFRKSVELSCKTIGTTVVMAHFNEDTVSIANVGDSRLYRYRDGALEQLSEDHTIVYQMYLQGKLTKEEARTHKKSHIIYQHLGMTEDGQGIEPFILKDLEVKEGDRFLLCSDGLTDMLPDDDIGDAFSLNMNLENTAEILVNAALEAGGRDNVTVLVIEAV